MPTHIFFDLDSTLTPSRALMLPEHQPLFEQLCLTKDVIVVTGGAQQQIQKQIPLGATGNYCMLSQQGNYAIDKDGSVLWHEQVTAEQERVVRPFALTMTEKFANRTGLRPDVNDIFENRGSQFASSVIGFHASNEIKYKADPDQHIRRELLAAHPQELEALRTVGIQAMPAGTTTIDFILLGKHKGYNIKRLNDYKNWKTEECVYVGDALFKGGNDESVIGVIPTHPVSGPDETFRYIHDNLLS